MTGICFRTVQKPGSLRSECCRRGFGGGSLPGLHTDTSLCPYVALVSVREATNPITLGPTLVTSFDLN